MNAQTTILLLATAALVQLGSNASGAVQTKTPSPTNSVPAFVEQEIPKSVFVLPSSPKEGRNPFFPQSAQVVQQPIKPKDAAIDTSVFVLNGITPSGPKRTAMINGRTFEAGESGEIKLPGGSKVLIKCEEIRNDSVIIQVEGQQRELRMRFGL